jgi:hypothetical protein
MTIGRAARTFKAVCALGLAGALLAACGLGEADETYPTDYNRRANSTGTGGAYDDPGSVFGPGGLGLGIFSNDEAPDDGSGGGIGVNTFLWRASLDTLSFMPLASADPFGGVIITDWYSPPETQAERFKVTVYILGRDLRADGLRASVFRQVQNGGADWIDAKVEQKTAVDLENAILTRARELRVAGLR